MTPKTKEEGPAPRLALVVSEFNYDVTEMMLRRAQEEAEFLGAEVRHVLKVPGVFDMPLAVDTLLRRADVDAVVALGAVIEGETDHDQLIANQAARKLADLSVEHRKPLGLGVTGPGETRLQAQDRIDRAGLAVESVLKMLRRLRTIPP
jgi:6,7-dimethyl-8-ribityllumazine synthase